MSIAAGLGVIGFVGAAQWNSSIARQEFITSAQRVLITQAEQAQREQERLRAEIEDAEERVQGFQEADVGSQAAREQLNEQLAVARLKTGLTRVAGPGMVLEISDSQRQVPVGESATNYIVLVDDLRDIVTALWASGAEAITISGGLTEPAPPAERLVASTSIYGAGSAILVNAVPLSPPFRIEAIGPEGLHDRFLANPSYLARVARRIDAYGLEFASEARDELTLPAFIGNTRLRWGAPLVGRRLMAARIAQVSLFVVALDHRSAPCRAAPLAGAADRAVEPVGPGALGADRDGEREEHRARRWARRAPHPDSRLRARLRGGPVGPRHQRGGAPRDHRVRGPHRGRGAGDQHHGRGLLRSDRGQRPHPGAPQRRRGGDRDRRHPDHRRARSPSSARARSRSTACRSVRPSSSAPSARRTA